MARFITAVTKNADIESAYSHVCFWPTSAAQKILAEAPYSQFALNKLSQAPRGLEENPDGQCKFPRLWPPQTPPGKDGAIMTVQC